MEIKQKTRVVFFMKDLGIGGTQKTAQLLCRELVNKYSSFYDVYVVYDASHELTRFLDFSSIFGSEENRMIPYRFNNQGIEVLQSLRPDITHVFRAGMPEWPIPGKDIKQTIFVETNVFGFVDPNPHVHKTLFMSEWLLNASKRSHGDSVFDTLGRNGRFDYLNNPVDLPATEEKMDLNLEKNTIILGRCGRPDNGIYCDLNVKAAFLLKSKGYNIHFLVVAAPLNMASDILKYDIPYTAIAPTTDPVILSKFYNTIDILAHARADGETFGSNIAEAMIHGKPVVTHIAIPSHPSMGVFQAQTELVKHNFTGFVSQNSVPEYAEHLEKLVLSRGIRTKLGTAGKEWALANCTTEICGKKLHDTYQNLLYRFGHTLRSRS